MKLIEVTGESEQPLSNWHYHQLERGNILLFPKMPFKLAEEEQRFLLDKRRGEAHYHKNVAYRPAQNLLTGVRNGANRAHVQRILRHYSQQAARIFARFLPRYAEKSRLDFTSFRPFAEEDRNLSLHSRNNLLHVDTFPTRPVNGDRILRFFTNLNPQRPRVWLVSEPFDVLAEAFAKEAGILKAARRGSSPIRRAIRKLGKVSFLGPLARSPYDVLMHQFHNFLKENRRFQQSWPKQQFEFAPRSSWIVLTDMVSHAVLAGQFALEQTFIISQEAMVSPEYAPANVLERLAGMKLTWAD